MLAIAISVSCVAVALVVYGVEQWLDASAYRQAFEAPEARRALQHSGAASASAAVPSSAARVDAHQQTAPRAEQSQHAPEPSQKTATDAARSR
jgi:hypothetical protein